MAFDLGYQDRKTETEATIQAAIVQAVAVLDANPNVNSIVITSDTRPDIVIQVNRV
jgi:hypothetical protein